MAPKTIGACALVLVMTQVLFTVEGAVRECEWYKWRNGEVPYVIDASTTSAQRQTIHNVQKMYERFTCIRFHPWHGSTAKEQRFENGVVIFKQEANNACSSDIGNMGTIQKASCCSGRKCIQQVGHTLSLVKEFHSSDPSNRHFISVWPSIESTLSYNEIRSNGLDVSSDMMNLNSSGVRVMDRDGRKSSQTSSYLASREISNSHLCFYLRCQNFKMTCENDGYLTLLDNKCSCVCPPGLDPDTGCTTIMKKDSPKLKFPSGKYAILATKDGCPDKGFKESSWKQVTGDGNTFSTHLDLKGEFGTNHIQLSFCVSESDPDPHNALPYGSYCYLRKGGACHEGFWEGYAVYDDEPTSDNPNVKNGTLPDGIFCRNTRYHYCCYSTEFPSYELYWPSRKGFALISNHGAACQKIKSMRSERQNFIVAHGKRGFASSSWGPITNDSDGNLRTDICAYRPAHIDCGDVIELTAENPMQTFSSPREEDLECFWLIKAPAGERIILEFESVNVPCENKDDKLEIRLYRPGTNGKQYCGNDFKRDFISFNNTVHIELSTQKKSSSNFKAKVRILSRPELYYNADDFGETYIGLVNQSDASEACETWLKTQHCWDQTFDISWSARGLLLKKNYCRNPNMKTAFQPWCYTDANSCTRRFCDIRRESRDIDCDVIRQLQLCHLYLNECAQTCQNVISETTVCYEPPNVPMAQRESDNKTWHSVGERAGYFCTKNASKRFYKTCLKNGKWSPPSDYCVERECSLQGRNSRFFEKSLTERTFTPDQILQLRCGHQRNEPLAIRCMRSGEWNVSVEDICFNDLCPYCPKGWSFFSRDMTCYKLFHEWVTRETAASRCNAFGAILATPKTKHLHDFLRQLSQRNTWIGLAKDMAERWGWDDGKYFDGNSFSDWYEKPETNSDCVFQHSNGKWEAYPCVFNIKLQYVCMTGASTGCKDVGKYCGEWIKNKRACENQIFARSCPVSCGICKN